MHFGEVKINTEENILKFEVQIYYGDLEPNLTEVQLFADGINGESPQIVKMMIGEKLPGNINGYLYNANVSSADSAFDFTARVIPNLPNVSIPLEISRILWQR